MSKQRNVVGSKRLICALFAALLPLCALPACASRSDGSAANVSDTVTTAAEETGTERVTANVPDSDFEGYKFTIIVNGSVAEDIDSDESNGDSVNDAIYARNLYAEEKLRCDIGTLPADDVNKTAKNAILADDRAFDLIYDNFSALCTSYYYDQLLLNVYDIPYLDISQSYWDQKLIDEFSINNTLYLLTGDIIKNLSTVCIILSKPLWSDNKLADPYEMVNNGTWTLENMFAAASGVTRDLNGDSVLDQTDMWGLISDANFAYSFYMGSGEHMASVNSEGLTEQTFYSEKTVDICNTILSIMESSDDCILVERINGGYSYSHSMFSGGRALMDCISFYDVLMFRTMDTDAGILPVPKYSEAQKEYHCWSNATISLIAFPVNAENAERSGILVQTLAAESVNTLTPALFDVLLKGKVARDNESEGMIDLIMSSRFYDIGSIMNFGDMRNILPQLVLKDSTDFASAWAKKSKAVEKQIDKYNESLGLIAAG